MSNHGGQEDVCMNVVEKIYMRIRELEEHHHRLRMKLYNMFTPFAEQKTLFLTNREIKGLKLSPKHSFQNVGTRYL